MEYVNGKVLYYMIGYDVRTGKPLVRCLSKTEPVLKGSTNNVKYWEVTYDDKCRPKSLNREITKKADQDKILLVYKLYQDARAKGTTKIGELNPELTKHIPEESCKAYPDRIEKIERIAYMAKHGKVMPGKTPTRNTNERVHEKLKGMDL